jgi:hypothetical protein
VGKLAFDGGPAGALMLAISLLNATFGSEPDKTELPRPKPLTKPT